MYTQPLYQFYQYCLHLCIYYILTNNHLTLMDEEKELSFLPKQVVGVKLGGLFASPNVSPQVTLR